MSFDEDDFFVDMDRWVEEYRKKRAELEKLKILRDGHSYVADLIQALKGQPKGRTRIRIVEILESERKKAGLPIPVKFDSAVQSVYNRHSSDSQVFTKHKKTGEKPLFYSVGGKGSGTWALYDANALEWLKREINNDEK